jgi:hypothetical protein
MPRIAQQTDNTQAVIELPPQLVRDYLNPENATQNNLYRGLISLFNVDRVKQVFSLYKIGTGFGSFAGYTVYFQIDTTGKFRAGKLINYDTRTVKRIKSQNENPVNWLHAVYKDNLSPNYTLKQCLFGAHLLPLYPDKVVHLVESEKTALIGAIVNPDALWVATGGANCNINKEALAPLKNRKVNIYYDNDKAGKFWALDVKDFLPKCNIVVWLDATTKEGDDIGDIYLMQAMKARTIPPPLPVTSDNLDNDPAISEIEFAKLAIQALTELHDRFSYTESTLIERLGAVKFNLYQSKKIVVRLNTSLKLYKLSDNVMHYYN